MKPPAWQRGFTLVQISILLMVASLVLVAILPSSQSILSSDTATTLKLNNVLLALREYEAANGDLPCPADASQPISGTLYGVAAANAGTSSNCSGGSPAANYVDSTNHVAIGMVPVRALGLSNDYALDAFGRDITYAVDTDATTCGWASSSLTGQITVTDNGTAYSTIAALVSHGADGHGAWLPLPGSTGTAVRLNAGSTYSTGHVLTFTVTYNGLVTVSTTGGMPYLSLSAIFGNVGTGNVAQATYQSSTQTGSNMTVLTFSYTVASGDYAPSGLTIASSITLNGGTIMDGSACAATYFTAPNLTGVIIGTYIYVADENNNRVEVFNTSGTFLWQFPCVSGACTASSSAGQLNNPEGIAIDSGGHIWVTDAENYRIEEFTAAGSYMTTFGSHGTANGQFEWNGGFSIDGSGNIWVPDTNNDRLQEFNSSASFVQSIGGPSPHTCETSPSGTEPACASGSGTSQFYDPDDSTIDSSGNIWVADQLNNRVQEFNSAGSYLSQFGSHGIANGEFSGTSSVTFDAGGNIWIADENNNRVQQLNTAGSWLMTIPSSGCTGSPEPACPASASAGRFDYPADAIVDSSGNIWVMDVNNNRLQQLNSSGTWLLTIPSGCSNPSPPACTASSSSGKFDPQWFAIGTR
jgi:sugar lactone lactonase YvrE/type II secretory pathway pseudopilin PulG